MIPEKIPPYRDVPPVSPSEAGQKLIRLLSRRLKIPDSALYRWIRGGQIRINGHRCKAFDRVQPGDLLRLPPQAMEETAQTLSHAPEEMPPLPPILAKSGGIWACDKPAGLPVQGGTGHVDSVAARLTLHFGDNAFVPIPAHRLDLHTSGVLLLGATYEALRSLHEWFAAGKIHKEYLCWVAGRCTLAPMLARHWLIAGKGVYAQNLPASNGKLALSYINPLMARDKYSLLQVRIFTGRKRQIRAQLAALGFPIVGDGRYGGCQEQQLKLHCARMILPSGTEFSSLPPWKGYFKVDSLPPVLNNGERKAQEALTEGV